jgi:hypothetical protein
MRDLLGRDFRQVARRLHRAIHARHLSIGTASTFESPPALVFHLQHAERPATHDDACNQGYGEEHEYVDWIAVIGQRPRYVIRNCTGNASPST